MRISSARVRRRKSPPPRSKKHSTKPGSSSVAPAALDQRAQPKPVKSDDISLGRVLLGIGVTASTLTGLSKLLPPPQPAPELSVETPRLLETQSSVELSSSSVVTYSPKNYGIQVLSTADRGKAEETVEHLRELGLKEIRVFSRETSGQVTYQIVSGNSPHRENLSVTRLLLRGQEDYQDAFFQRFDKVGQDLSSYLQVGAFSQIERAEDVLSQLEQRGFPNAFLREVDGLFKVQLGPFLNDSEAFTPQDRLSEAGFENFLLRQEQGGVESLTRPSTGNAPQAVFRPFVLSLKRSYSSKSAAENATQQARRDGFGTASSIREGENFKVVLGAYQSQDQADLATARASRSKLGKTSLKWRRYYQGDYSAHGVNFSREPIPSEYFEGVQTSKAQVRHLLKRYDSWILKEKIRGREMLDVLMDISHQESVDPLILLSRIQTEMSAVESSKRPSQEKLDWLTGYGATDSGRRRGHAGMNRQLTHSVRRLKENYRAIPRSEFPLLKSVDYGKKLIEVQDPVAYSLLQYTPHTVDTKLPTRGGGTYNAVRLFHKYRRAVN